MSNNVLSEIFWRRHWRNEKLPAVARLDPKYIDELRHNRTLFSQLDGVIYFGSIKLTEGQPGECTLIEEDNSSDYINLYALAFRYLQRAFLGRSGSHGR